MKYDLKYIMILLLIVFVILLFFIKWEYVPIMIHLPSLDYKNRVVWSSKEFKYNPSISNNVIAIRENNKKHTSVFSTLYSYYFIENINNIRLYKLSNSQDMNEKSLDLDLEDPRIFYHNDKYYILCFDGTDDKIYKIVRPNYVILDNQWNILKHSEFYASDLKRNSKQKNWNFFKDLDNNLLIISDIHPEMTIRSFNEEDGRVEIISKINTENIFNGYKCHIRCSTGFIPWNKDELIGAIHLRSHYNYRTIFVVINGRYPYTIKRISYPYNFKNKVIEFVSGLDWNDTKDKLYIALGINDYTGEVLEIDPKDILFVDQ